MSDWSDWRIEWKGGERSAPIDVEPGVGVGEVARKNRFGLDFACPINPQPSWQNETCTGLRSGTMPVRWSRHCEVCEINFEVDEPDSDAPCPACTYVGLLSSTGTDVERLVVELADRDAEIERLREEVSAINSAWAVLKSMYDDIRETQSKEVMKNGGLLHPDVATRAAHAKHTGLARLPEPDPRLGRGNSAMEGE